MKTHQAKLAGMVIYGLLQLAPSLLTSQDIVIKTSQGENISLEIDAQEPFSDVMEKICSVCDKNLDGDPPLVIQVTDDFFFHRKAEIVFDGKGRNYSKLVTEEEKDNVRYILKSLASRTWTDLLSSRSSLNRAGERIDHLHPLKFLACIFSDDELRGCLHVIRDRKQVWKNFFAGLEETLDEEAQKNNIGPFLQDFANNLNISFADISDLVKSTEWPDFIDALLKLLPRKGNPDRYGV